MRGGPQRLGNLRDFHYRENEKSLPQQLCVMPFGRFIIYIYNKRERVLYGSPYNTRVASGSGCLRSEPTIIGR